MFLWMFDLKVQSNDETNEKSPTCPLYCESQGETTQTKTILLYLDVNTHLYIIPIVINAMC